MGALHPNSNSVAPYGGTTTKQSLNSGTFSADQSCPLSCSWDGNRIRVEHHHLADVLNAEKNHGASATTKDDNHGKLDNSYDLAHAAANIYHRCYHRDQSYVHNTVPFSFSLDETTQDININEGKNPNLDARSCECQCAKWHGCGGNAVCKFDTIQVSEAKCPTSTKPAC